MLNATSVDAQVLGSEGPLGLANALGKVRPAAAEPLSR
jgi:hypothetical protein